MSAGTACGICCDLGIINLGPSGIELCHAFGCEAKNRMAPVIEAQRRAQNRPFPLPLLTLGTEADSSTPSVLETVLETGNFDEKSA